MFESVKKWFLAFFVLSVCFSFFSCFSFPASTTATTTTEGTKMARDGHVVQASVVTKNFNVLGFVYAETTAILDDYGNIIKGSKISFDMLIREAKKLGADDIINLRIDEEYTITTENRTDRIGSGGRPVYAGATVNYKANALAIKYIN